MSDPINPEDVVLALAARRSGASLSDFVELALYRKLCGCTAQELEAKLGGDTLDQFADRISKAIELPAAPVFTSRERSFLDRTLTRAVAELGRELDQEKVGCRRPYVVDAINAEMDVGNDIKKKIWPPKPQVVNGYNSVVNGYNSDSYRYKSAESFEGDQ